MTFLKWFLSSPRRAGGSSKGDWSPFEAAPPEAGKSVSAETLAALSGSGLPPENGVWGHAPPSAFGRAAASPQTRQMRCWLSAAQAAYHSFPSLPLTKTRSLRCTAFFPPKPLRWVSAGALLGTVIKTPISHFFGISMCGGYHYPRRAIHAVETLDARGSRRRIRCFYASVMLTLCGLNISTAGTHATPSPKRAHSGLQSETRGVFTA